MARRRRAFPIIIGDVVFPQDEPIRSSFRTRVVRLAYSFAIFRDSQKELTLIGGISSTELSYRVTGESDELFASTITTLPVIGASGRINLTEKISLDARLEIFAVDIPDRSGDLIDFAIAGAYQFNERFTAGIGLQLFRQDVSTSDESFAGEYRINYFGPLAYARIRF